MRIKNPEINRPPLGSRFVEMKPRSVVQLKFQADEMFDEERDYKIELAHEAVKEPIKETSEEDEEESLEAAEVQAKVLETVTEMQEKSDTCSPSSHESEADKLFQAIRSLILEELGQP